MKTALQSIFAKAIAQNTISDLRNTDELYLMKKIGKSSKSKRASVSILVERYSKKITNHGIRELLAGHQKNTSKQSLKQTLEDLAGVKI